MEQNSLELFEVLMQISFDQVESIISVTEANALSALFSTIGAKLKNTASKDVLSNNILHAFQYTLQRDKLTEEIGLLKNLRNTLLIICQSCNQERIALVEMGVLNIISELLKKEIASFYVEYKTDEYVRMGQFVSVFLPAICDPEYHDISKSSDEIIRKGTNASETSAAEVIYVLSAIFPTVYSICQMQNCPTTYQFLLVKMIYWADKLTVLPNLVPIEELIRFVKVLLDMDSNNRDYDVFIALSIVNTLRHKHLDCLANEEVDKLFLQKKFLNVKKWYFDRRYSWIYGLNDPLSVTYWLDDNTKWTFLKTQNILSSQIEIINSKLDSIIQVPKNGEKTQLSLDANYVNLREFVKKILKLPDITRHKGILTVNSEGVNEFKELVTSIIKTLDTLITHNDYVTIHPDLQDTDETLSAPNNYMDIRLDIYKSASFDVLLGPSKSPEKFKSDPLIRTLRLLSILYEVNENWGILFGNLSTKTVIARNCFNSNLLIQIIKSVELVNQEQATINRFKDNKQIPKYICDIAKEYSFLMPMTHRIRILRQKSPQCRLKQCLSLFTVPRKNILNYVTDNLNSFLLKDSDEWRFEFAEEIASGLGPSKEFYTVFSRDCQTYDKGLWCGESGNVIGGVSYVNPESGIFPSPKSSSDSRTKSYLNALGVIMAKCIVDKRRLDINFSNAFYKCFFKNNLVAQHLSLTDIKYVMPSIFKFIESLVEALREKWFIKNDKSLSTEEQNQAVAIITCDGCSFEDLCINFTLPGFPDIEMIEGGSQKILDIDNLEEYLRLLVWWLLYRNTHEVTEQIARGFDKILSRDVMRCFYPHECGELICGIMKEQWTVEYLQANCIIEDFTLKTPVVQHLFDVLSSLSASDQRNFLQFATSLPRLPIGGLVVLRPKLRIKRKGSLGNPENDLPSASTCCNCLFIPEYSSKQVLEAKLLLAIREGTNSFAFV